MPSIWKGSELMRIGSRACRARFAVIILCSLGVLTGCSSLPSAGPSVDDIERQSAAAGGAGFELIAITPTVNSVLAKRKADSFINSFGDYSPSVDPLIGIGDTISITIWEAAAGGLFSAPLLTDRFSTGSKSATIPDQVVGRDGSITVPYAGRIRVIGQNSHGVQHSIEHSLEGKAIQPQVLVSVVRSVSNSVTVSGEVVNGARVPLSTKGDRVLDVIAAAGGVRTPVRETFIQLTRGKHTARVGRFAGTSQGDPAIALLVVAADKDYIVAEMRACGAALEIAALNSQTSTTVVGPHPEVQDFARHCRARRVAAVELDLD